MTFLFVALLGLVGIGLLGAAGYGLYLASQRVKAAQAREVELIPGMPTNAPASWAGSHDPEARMHRRLRDALAALRANRDFDNDGALLPLRVDLEMQARALDDQLVATAALPAHLRREPMDRLEAAVRGIEQGVADVAGVSVGDASARVARVLEDLRSATGTVAQARAALDELDANPTGTVAPPAVAQAPTPPAQAETPLTTSPPSHPATSPPSSPATSPPVPPTAPPVAPQAPSSSPPASPTTPPAPPTEPS